MTGHAKLAAAHRLIAALESMRGRRLSLAERREELRSRTDWSRGAIEQIIDRLPLNQTSIGELP
jgi:hypothetical protein